ncbi:MAG: chromosome segregation protein SMC [Nitrospirota bacterium]
MHFERMELLGFKSFADRTVFTFQPGITAIVGPNGCGKSNIVDAFRWTLGEQSVKNIRGDRMEDIIFNGSENRKPTGMAEVNLVISSQGFSENDPSKNHKIFWDAPLSIIRRFYRSGEGEFFINKVPCRLKDIRDIFLDTGIGARSHSIIEQGMIGEILNARPQERRFLIEETAGIMKYKVRKTEAIQKLQTAQQNLLRIGDIVTELKRQMDSLHRQVKKAERYRKIKEEIKVIELNLASKEHVELTASLKGVEEHLRRLKEEEAKKSAAFSENELDLENKRIELTLLERSTHSLQNEILESEKRLTQKEGDISLMRNQTSNLDIQTERAKNEMEELSGSVKTIDLTASQRHQEMEKLRSTLIIKEEALRQLYSQFKLKEEDITELHVSQQDARKRLFEKAAELSDVKNRILHLEHIQQETKGKEERLKKEEQEAESRIAEIDGEIQVNEKDILALRESIERLLKEKETLIERISEREIWLREKQTEIQNTREEAVAATSRLQSLKELEASLEGYSEGIRSILGHPKKSKDFLGTPMESFKLHGLIADMIETSPEYEVAIESALGEALQDIIVDSHMEIKKVISYLKNEGKGRGTFVPLQPRRQSKGQGTRGKGQEYPETWKALDLVNCKEGYEEIVHFLLSDVIVVEDLDKGIDLWHSDSAEKRIVTLDGEVIEPWGAVTGGSNQGRGVGLLKRKREIKELDSAIKRKHSLISSLEEELRVMNEEIESLKQSQHTLEEKLHTFELEILDREKMLSIQHDEYKRLANRIDIIKAEMNGLTDEWQKTEDNLSQLKEASDRVLREKTQLEGDIHVADEELKTKSHTLEEMRNEITELKVEMQSVIERLDGIQRECEKLEETKRETALKIGEYTEELREIDKKRKEYEKLIQEAEIQVKSLFETITEHHKHLDNKKESYDLMLASITELEEALKQQRSLIDEMRQEISSIEIKRTELSLRIEHLLGMIRSQYGIGLDGYESEEEFDMARDEAELRVSKLKERLDALGPVNLGAIDEFNELKERYDFLASQQTDLLTSIEQLEEAIIKINATTKSILKDTFNELNRQFQEVYRYLFSGGRAELILLEDDILESGIDIIAQPPGKRLQNISLLSGGEKALTSIALLIASFLVKPSPLCLLDEIDAPLDDANVDRFTSLIKNLTDKSQFIIITHNKRTMESADILYGITMQEPGISKVISVKLKDL